MHRYTLTELLQEAVFNVVIWLIMLELFLAVKAIGLLVKTYSRYGKQCRWLWFVPLPALLFTILSLIFQREAVFPALAEASFLALLACCKGVELYHRELFMREANMKDFLQDVSHPLSWLQEK